MKFRILSFNCWLINVPFVGGKNLKQRLMHLPSRLAALDADLICLQEIWHPKIAVEIKARLESHGYRYAYSDPKNFGTGLMLLSKYPFGQVHQVLHRERARGLEKFLAKGVSYCDWECSGTSVRVINAHLGCEITTTQRIAQIQHFMNIASLEWSGPLILAGDLNFHPSIHPGLNNAEEYTLLCGEYGFSDCLAVANGERAETLGRENPYVTGSWQGKAVDYILYRNFSGLDVLDARVVFDKPLDLGVGNSIFLSDHFGVCATFGSQ